MLRGPAPCRYSRTQADGGSAVFNTWLLRLQQGLFSFQSAGKGENNGKVPAVIFNGSGLDKMCISSTHILLVRLCHIITVKHYREWKILQLCDHKEEKTIIFLEQQAVSATICPSGDSSYVHLSSLLQNTFNNNLKRDNPLNASSSKSMGH